MDNISNLPSVELSHVETGQIIKKRVSVPNSIQLQSQFNLDSTDYTGTVWVTLSSFDMMALGKAKSRVEAKKGTVFAGCDIGEIEKPTLFTSVSNEKDYQLVIKTKFMPAKEDKDSGVTYGPQSQKEEMINFLATFIREIYRTTKCDPGLDIDVTTKKSILHGTVKNFLPVVKIKPSQYGTIGEIHSKIIDGLFKVTKIDVLKDMGISTIAKDSTAIKLVGTTVRLSEDQAIQDGRKISENALNHLGLSLVDRSFTVTRTL